MDGAVAFLKVMFLLILLFVISLIILLCRGFISKFLDKISPFPFLRDGGNYKYKNFKEEITYQGQILWFLFSSILGSVAVLLSFGFNLIGLGLCFAILFPSLMLLFRINIFSDDNSLPETGLGYDFLESWMLSLFGSFGFIMLISAFYISLPLYFPVIGLILTLISSLIPIFPDFINKLLSYDIRSKKGKIFFAIFTGIAIVIQWAFILGSLYILI